MYDVSHACLIHQQGNEVRFQVHDEHDMYKRCFHLKVEAAGYLYIDVQKALPATASKPSTSEPVTVLLQPTA